MNNLTVTTQITKKIILQELMKIKIDHSINISEKELDAKINLLFEDCKDVTCEKFLANCDVLRKQDLFGKFPANHKFINPQNQNEKSEFAKYMEGR